MSIGNLSIRARLSILLVFVNVLPIAASGYAWYAISRLNNQLEATIAVQNQVEAASDLSRPGVVQADRELGRRAAHVAAAVFKLLDETVHIGCLRGKSHTKDDGK